MGSEDLDNEIFLGAIARYEAAVEVEEGKLVTLLRARVKAFCDTYGVLFQPVNGDWRFDYYFGEELPRLRAIAERGQGYLDENDVVAALSPSLVSALNYCCPVHAIGAAVEKYAPPPETLAKIKWVVPYATPEARQGTADPKHFMSANYVHGRDYGEREGALPHCPVSAELYQVIEKTYRYDWELGGRMFAALPLLLK